MSDPRSVIQREGIERTQKESSKNRTRPSERAPSYLLHVLPWKNRAMASSISKGIVVFLSSRRESSSNTTKLIAASILASAVSVGVGYFVNSYIHNHDGNETKTKIYSCYFERLRDYLSSRISIKKPQNVERDDGTEEGEEIVEYNKRTQAVSQTQESDEPIVYRDRSNSLWSTNTTSSTNHQTTSGTKRSVVELLVHNVSHSDVVFSLGRIPADTTTASTMNEVRTAPAFDDTIHRNENKNEKIFCRPRFSAFDCFSRRVYETSSSAAQRNQELLPLIYFPKYERSDSSPRYTLVTPRPCRQKDIPVGFALPSTATEKGIQDTGIVAPITIDTDADLANLRIRGRDQSTVQRWIDQQEDIYLNGIYFPLLAPLIITWVQRIQDKYPNRATFTKMVIVLVTGVGTPRNWTHSVTGNSTEYCAKLMKLFLQRLYPHITIETIHSETNLFRYDENISFAKRELMPCIEAYRDAHATGTKFPDELDSMEDRTEVVARSLSHHHSHNYSYYNPDWRDTFHVTLSFADGSLARAHAIQAALRPYRATFFHFWQLKTFWHESKVTEEDIEILTFEDMETVPAMEVSKTSEKVQLVVEEILKFKSDFLSSETSRDGQMTDLRSFWLRKTQKPVLAVLLVETPNGKKQLFRGTNMEVSMPTGSLCAERCVIGSALANTPGLRREDLRMVAVLAVPLPRLVLDSSTSITNTNTCSFIPSSIDAAPVCVGGNTDTTMTRSTSILSLASIRDEQTDSSLADKNIVIDSLNRNDSSSTHPQHIPIQAPLDEVTTAEKQVKHINIYMNTDVASDAGSEYGQITSRFKRPVMGSSRMQKTKVVVHHEAVRTVSTFALSFRHFSLFDIVFFLLSFVLVVF